MQKRRRRSKMEILDAILLSSCERTRQSKIVHRANLNSNLFKKYFAELSRDGFMERDGDQFRTTEKGREFLLDHVQAVREVKVFA